MYRGCRLDGDHLTTGKLITRRPRPSIRRGSPPIGRLGLASSFPSTHAACAFVIASWMSRSRQRSWLHLLAATVGYVRVHRRAHYLSDVLAGGVLDDAVGQIADRAWELLMGPMRGLRNTRKAVSERSEVQLEHAGRARMASLRNVRAAVVASVVISVLLEAARCGHWWSDLTRRDTLCAGSPGVSCT